MKTKLTELKTKEKHLMKTKILRNIFLRVGVLFALARLHGADMNDGGLNFSNMPLLSTANNATAEPATGRRLQPNRKHRCGAYGKAIEEAAADQSRGAVERRVSIPRSIPQTQGRRHIHFVRCARRRHWHISARALTRQAR